MAVNGAGASSGETSAASAHRVKSHRTKKGSDPFLELSDDALTFTEQPSPCHDKDEKGHGRSQSLFADVRLRCAIHASRGS